MKVKLEDIKRKDYPYITQECFESIMRRDWGPVKKHNALVKQSQKICGIMTSPYITRVHINIEWKRSKMWGYNPHAEAWVTAADGQRWKLKDTKASGYGYDKESTVVADLLSQCLRRQLKKALDSIRKRNGKMPYGFYDDTYDGIPDFMSGGVGMTSIHGLISAMKGTIDTVHGKLFDTYTYTFKK